MKKLHFFLTIVLSSLVLTSCEKATEPVNTSADPDGGIETEEKTSSDNYKDYSPEELASAQKSDQKVVLFFHAGWCPTCKEADKNFKSNPEKIPSDVTVLKVDYDSEKELKAKYNVTYQHTFVQVDDNGEMITTWNSGDLEELAKKVK